MYTYTTILFLTIHNYVNYTTLLYWSVIVMLKLLHNQTPHVSVIGVKTVTGRK